MKAINTVFRGIAATAITVTVLALPQAASAAEGHRLQRSNDGTTLRQRIDRHNVQPVVQRNVLIGGGICGDSILDAGESCDDGNAADGDGCSASCQVESGWECTLPEPPLVGSNQVADGSFEEGSPNSSWIEASDNFGTPLCDAGCNGNLAYDGNWFTWFGGATVVDNASIEQTITIAETSTTLEFQLLVGLCGDPADFMRVTIDGLEVFTTMPCTTELDYNLRSVDITGFADGGTHVLRFESTVNGDAGDVTDPDDDIFSSFFLDSIALSDNTGGEPPVPSSCSLMPETCFEENFGATGMGSLGDWTVFNTGASNLDWGTTDDGVCWSGALGPAPADNVTGGSGEAACIDTDQNGFGTVVAYLCSPQVDFSTAANPELRFKYNYHRFTSVGADDRFEVLVGDLPPDPVSIDGYTSIYSNTDLAGALADVPGVNIELPLVAGNQYVCFAYGGDFDWYAQVDDVLIGADACEGVDSDADGIPDSADNCTEIHNPDQLDTDADGFGNVCDGDFNNDCAQNFVDLGAIKSAFLSAGTGAGEDMNGDGSVNFIDIGLFKAVFLAPPGPSGLPNICD